MEIVFVNLGTTTESVRAKRQVQSLKHAGLTYVVVADKDNMVSEFKCGRPDPRKFMICSLATFILMLPCAYECPGAEVIGCLARILLNA